MDIAPGMSGLLCYSISSRLDTRGNAFWDLVFQLQMTLFRCLGSEFKRQTSKFMIISSEVEEKHFAECILGIFFRKFVFRGGGMNSIILCAIFRIHIAICVALEYFFWALTLRARRRGESSNLQAKYNYRLVNNIQSSLEMWRLEKAQM